MAHLSSTPTRPHSAAPRHSDLEAAVQKLFAYCQGNGWAGHDPYDALNSRLISAVPLLDNRIARLALTQTLKRSPINLRSLLFIPKTQNPKALALFLSAALKLSSIKGDEIALEMIARISELRSEGVPYSCWGYSFPWQTRTIIVPAGSPNLVCTVFVADSLLDAYERLGNPKCLEMATSAGEYIVNELFWAGDGVAGFAYPTPSRRSQVHNANFLASALLARLYKHTGDRRYLTPALAVTRHSAGEQYPDGSWAYGEEKNQEWIDNFHTGYNLCALRSIAQHAKTDEFEPVVRRGFEFYRDHFLNEDGSVKYFHDRAYPVDTHCVAQSIITLIALKDLDPGNVARAKRIFKWAMANMWDEKGFFYYRILRLCKIRTSYLRWTQAWMLLAMVTLLEDSSKEATSA